MNLNIIKLLLAMALFMLLTMGVSAGSCRIIQEDIVEIAPSLTDISSIDFFVTNDKYYDQWSLKGLTLDQSYEVETFNNEVLSIVFYQYTYVAGTPHPNNNCHAVTINLNTAEKLLLSDFIESYKDFENSILDGNYEILYGGLKAMNKDEIIKLVNDKLEQDHFYISKSGNICIIIDLQHSCGGYSIIQINRWLNLN